MTLDNGREATVRSTKAGSPAAPGPLPFSAEEYQPRIQAARRLMEAHRLDVLLCYASKIMPGNVRYLTGYETRLGLHDACYCLMNPGHDPEFTLLSNASFECPAEQTWVPNVVVTSDFAGEIAARIQPQARRIGIAGYKYLPLPVHLSLTRSFAGAELVDMTEEMARARMAKSAAEIEVLRRCAAITDLAGEAFFENVRVGVSEREIAAAAEYAMKLHGSDEVSFSTQVGCGDRTSRVVVYPGDAVLQPGDPVQLDCGATCLGYRGDLSRVATAGRPSREYLRMANAAAEMYFALLQTVRPGALGGDIARVGIEVAHSRGLDQFLYRSPNHAPGFMGHGIGCHYCEPPELTPDDSTVIEENMVLVIEPILMRPGLGGVKLEDAVRVTASGAERLSSLRINSWAQYDA